MKRVFVVMLIVCTAIWIADCNKDKTPKEDDPETILAIDGDLSDGSIIIDDDPDVEITLFDEFLEPDQTEPWIAPTGMKKTGVKSTDDNADLRANEYRFKLVAAMSTLLIGDYEVQATDVKLTDDGYAIVSYNDKGPKHRGGVVVYKYTIQDGTLETVKVDVKKVTGIQLPKAELSAIDFYNGKLYMIGASSEPKFGYDEEEDRFNYAFMLVMDMNADKTFNKKATPKIVKLTSFQGTSIRVRNNRIYVTTGDGTNGTKGGLYILKTDYSLVKFIEGKKNARSVDVDADNIYLMQAEPARITKFDLDGDNEELIYSTTDESMQPEAKSEILVWGDYVFVAENESGLRMLNKQDGVVNMRLDRPGEDPDRHVTNSVFMNSDVKKNAQGQNVQTNMLMLANGEKGVFWYDIVSAFGNDWIVASKNNSILGELGLSTNFIESKGNIVFVANGLGGLKVLYIGSSKDDTWNCSNALRYATFLKDNGNDKGKPLTRKVGNVYFMAEGENLVVYIFSGPIPDDFVYDDAGAFNPNVKTVDLKNSGVIFGPNLEYFDNEGLLTGGGNSANLKDKNINNGAMKDMNAQYRTIIPGGVKFTFPKEALPLTEDGKLMCIVYSGNGAWGYGDPNGPSGSTGTGANNNGQIIYLEVTLCEPNE